MSVIKILRIVTTMLLLSTGAISCATSSDLIVLKFQERSYRPCETKEFVRLFPTIDPSQNVGLFCWRYCTKYKFLREHVSSNCKEWHTDVQDIKNPEVFKMFRDAGFILRRED